MNSLASFLWLLSLYAKQQKCQVIWKKVYFYRPAQSCSPVRWETSVKQKTALPKRHRTANFPWLRLPASISALGRASYPTGRGPNSSSLFPPLAAVVAVALAELGSIAGAAPPPTRCLSNYSKCASGSPLRGNRRICAVVLPSPLGNFR